MDNHSERIPVVHGRSLQCFQSDSRGSTVTVDDSLRVNFLVDQLFSFSQKLSGQHGHGRGSITDFIVLNLGDVFLSEI